MALVDDPNVWYRRNEIQKRATDTLIGISKGVLADGVVSQEEAESLLSWLAVNLDALAADPFADRLFLQLEEMLRDDVLDEDEARELRDLLMALSGGASLGGEMSKPTSLPLNDPPPPVVFADRRFVFTGQFLFGRRRDCHDAVLSRGGKAQTHVTLAVDYLVIGQYVTPSWKHESFGTKILKAMEYRDEGKSALAIISEDHWARELEATSV